MAATGTDFASAHPHADVIADTPPEDVAVVADEKVRRMSAIPGIAEINDGAITATETEKNMGLIEGFRLYPKAVGWSIALSTCIVMEGYDTILLGNLFGFPAFQRQFGEPAADGTYQLTAAWQAGLGNGANVGEIIGLFLTGYFADKFGYKKTLGASLVLVAAFIFLLFFANSNGMLLAGEILCGIPWGVFQTLTTTYASEVCPVPLRAYLTTYVNLCWVFGQLIASGVLRSFLNGDPNDSLTWRIPYAIQWMWPVPILIAVILAPESPWWLVRKGRLDDAKKSLLRLTSRNSPAFNPDDTIAMMVHTNELEMDYARNTSYWECFRGVNLRRTEIACVVWACQALCGSAFMGYSTYFYEQAGLSTENSFNMTMAQFGLGAIGTIASWFVMIPFGRRTIYVWGLGVLTSLLVLIGILGCLPGAGGKSGVSWGIGSLLLIYTFIYDFTVGPVCYSLVAELPSTRLRQKTVVLSRNFYNFWGIINNIWTPYMLNPTAWNWGAKSGFFWAGLCALLFVYCFFRLPEPKGRTYGELDILFENHVPARKFASTNATQFMGQTVRLPSISESVDGKGKVEHLEKY